MNDDDAEIMEEHRLYWWWRLIGDPAWVQMGEGAWPMIFAAQYERSAFLYELAARVNGRFEFRKPWILLPRKKRDLLALRWPVKNYIGSAVHWTPESFPGFEAEGDKGCTRYRKASFNLALNDEALVAAFRRYILDERKRTGIYPRRNSGQRRRPLSWRPIELLDLRNLHANGKVDRQLDDSERSQVSKAITTYRASKLPRK